MWVIEFFHVIIGILWIGLLYFFNLVQVQSMPKMVEEGAAKQYTQIILPRALFLFRHAALWTVITGIAYYMAGRGTVQGIPSGEIMIGMLLGIIMAGNVWFIIWPNQKIMIGLAEGDKAVAGPKAALASRTNTLLSLPMLYFMVASVHGFAASGGAWASVSTTALIIGLVIIVVIEANAIWGKMLGLIQSVSGVITSSIILAIIMAGIVNYM